MTGQAWEQADFSCGTCGHCFTAATEQEYVNLYSQHLNAHALLAMLTPGMREELRALLALADVEGAPS